LPAFCGAITDRGTDRGIDRGGGSGAVIEALDHVQLAMPSGGEDQAPHLAKRGGCWFERGPLKVHLGVDMDFRPARKAHPAFRVADLAVLTKRLSEAGFSVTEDEPLAGYERCYVDDPFGNRIEMMEAL
jgi:catechol 2,3-dioxygenase-like lactoylglutathione lyase family enzyme